MYYWKILSPRVVAVTLLFFAAVMSAFLLWMAYPDTAVAEFILCFDGILILSLTKYLTIQETQLEWRSGYWYLNAGAALCKIELCHPIIILPQYILIKYQKEHRFFIGIVYHDDVGETAWRHLARLLNRRSI